MKQKKIYLAGGWFTPEMEEEHTRIAHLLNTDDTFRVFNPRMASQLTPSSTTQDAIDTFKGNVENIADSDAVVVIYDRKDVGTIWEAGYAYAICKPIIYYAETLGDKPFNLMLAKTGKFAANEEELMALLKDDESYKFNSLYQDYQGVIE